MTGTTARAPLRHNSDITPIDRTTVLAVLSDLILDPLHCRTIHDTMSQTREQPAQQAHHAKGPWMVTAGGLDDAMAGRVRECVPISLDLGVSESRAERRKSNYKLQEGARTNQKCRY